MMAFSTQVENGRSPVYILQEILMGPDIPGAVPGDYRPYKFHDISL